VSHLCCVHLHGLATLIHAMDELHRNIWRNLRCTRLVDKRVDSPPMNLPRYVLKHVNDSFHVLVTQKDRMLVGRRIFEKIRSDNYLKFGDRNRHELSLESAVAAIIG
jgi:hypothetical protein